MQSIRKRKGIYWMQILFHIILYMQEILGAKKIAKLNFPFRKKLFFYSIFHLKVSKKDQTTAN